MKNKFNGISIAIVYVAFFTLIGVAVYLTQSATPLWALLLTPTYRHDD